MPLDLYNIFETKFGVKILLKDKLPILDFYYKGNEGVGSPWPYFTYLH